MCSTNVSTVQQSVLKCLNQCVVNVSERCFSRIITTNILFVASGANAGLDRLIAHRLNGNESTEQNILICKLCLRTSGKVVIGRPVQMSNKPLAFLEKKTHRSSRVEGVTPPEYSYELPTTHTTSTEEEENAQVCYFHF